MEDFLYIIVAIIWLVYSVYNSKQKKLKKQAMEEQRKRGVPPMPAPKRSLLEELLNPQGQMPLPSELITEESEEDIEYEYTDPTEGWKTGGHISDNEFIKTYEDEVPASYFEDQYSARAAIVAQAPEYNRPILLEEEPVINEKEEEEFDLRRAVIYSEILNPRYI